MKIHILMINLILIEYLQKLHLSISSKKNIDIHLYYFCHCF